MQAEFDEDARAFTVAAATGEYLLKRCTACMAHNEPSLIACKSCGRTDALEYVSAGREGTLVAVTRVHRSFDPDLEVSLPLLLGVVRLREGPLAVGRVDGDAGGDLPRPGSVVDVWFEAERPIAIPVFRVRP